MNTKLVTFFAAATLSLTGAAWAQTPVGGGSAEGNMNSPGSVKSNSEKGMPETASPTAGAGTGAAVAPTAPPTTGGSTESNMNNPGSVKSE